MNIKKYLGNTMQEAFDAVKRDIGPDAIILHTKTKRKNGIMGLMGKEMVEITASQDVQILNQKPKPKEKKKPQHLVETLYKKQESLVKEETQESQDVYDESPGTSTRYLHYELTEIKALVNNLIKRTQHSEQAHLTDELMEFYLLLLQQQVSDDLSKDIIARINSELRNEELKDMRAIRDVLKKSIIRMLNNVNPIILDKPAKKVALIGPTGVGKTTTIAKLAASFALKENKKVGLITIDTYRIAAVEQLRTYADIINIPLEIVLTPNELKRALHHFQDRDLILVDTAGRSQKNKMQMSELKTYLDIMEPDETHLVLSTVTNPDNVIDAIKRFDDIRFDKLLFTKLDESVNFGLILNIIYKMKKSLSYITTGQNVPDDIEIGDPDFLAGLILGERTV